MARQDVPVTVLDDTGVVPGITLGHIDGHSVPNAGGDVILALRNTGAGSHTVTARTPATRDDLAVAERTIAVAAGTTKYAGPFTPSIYGQTGADEGELWLDFDASPAEVSVSALKWPKG